MRKKVDGGKSKESKLPSKEERKRRVASGVVKENSGKKRFKGTRSEDIAMEELRKRGLKAASSKRKTKRGKK